MKVEYIPGDLVMYNGEVNRIEETINTTYVELEDYAVSIPIYDIKPTPLTPEILEKNGWKKSRIYYTNKVIPRIKLCTCEEGYEDKWSVSVNGDIMGGYIYYVHQLQHILFAFKFNTDMEV